MATWTLEQELEWLRGSMNRKQRRAYARLVRDGVDERAALRKVWED